MLSDLSFEAVCALDDRIVTEHSTLPTATLEYNDIKKESLLGMGGSAQVYRATVESIETNTIALKEPRFGDGGDTTISEMFANEAELWSYLDHEHIIQVIDWGTEPHPWIALEYADGGTLADHIEQQNLEKSLWMAICLAQAVKYAHTRGVVHLDLKPENILLEKTSEGTWEIPKVTDWGLAKLLLKYTGEIEGLSYYYAAPEQFRPEEFHGADEKTDVYQLGGVIYSLLTGQPPVSGSKQELVDQTLAGDIAPPSSINPALPASLDQPILRALETEPTDRYEDILLMRQALERAFLDVYAIQEYPQPRVNSRRTGEIGSTGPPSAVSVEWKIDGSFIPTASPAVIGDTIYLTTRQGTVHAFSVHSGTIHWGSKISDTQLTAPVIGDDRLYVADENGIVYMIELNGDRQISEIDIGRSIRSPLLLVDDRIIAVTTQGVIKAISPTATELWSTQAPGNVRAPAAIYHNNLIVPAADGLAAFDLETGTRSWTYQREAPSIGASAAVGEHVYTADRNNISAIDIADGGIRWNISTDYTPTGLAVTPSICYVSTDGGGLLALDTASGSKKWQYERPNVTLTPPMIGDDLLFIGSAGRKRKTLPQRMDDVHAVERKTGTERWGYATDNEVKHCPVITGSSLLVVDMDGGVYSLG